MGESSVYRKLVLAVAILAPGLAWGQSYPSPHVNNLAVDGTITGANVTATGGTTARTLAARAADVVNILDYGADPSGVADSTSALNAAFAALPSSGGHIWAPAGNYHYSGALAWSGKRVTLTGEGMGVTTFTPTTTSAILTISPGDVLKHVNISGISFIANASTPIPNAVSVVYPAVASYLYTTTVIENVEIRSSPTTTPFANTFTGGLILTGLWNSTIRNVSVVGDTVSAPIAGTFGIQYSLSYNVGFDHDFFGGVDTAIEQTDYSEGVVISHPTMVGVNTGFINDVAAGAVNTYYLDSLRITGGEWDVYNAAVVLNRVVTAWISDARMALRNDGGALSVISAADSTNIRIHHNILEGNSATATATAVTDTFTSVHGDQMIVSDNTCSLIGQCVTFGTGTTYSLAHDNVIFGASGYKNAATNNGSGTTNFLNGYGFNSLVPLASATGLPVTLSATGGDANVQINLVPVGTGAFKIGSGGNAEGANSIDMQNVRNAVTQVASGAQATIVGGEFNTASGIQSIAGGFSTTSSGPGTVALGYGASASGTAGAAFGGGLTTGNYSMAIGNYSTDRGRIGNFAQAVNHFSVVGDAQTTSSVLLGTGATASAIRLTSNANAGSTTNCINIPDNAAFSVEIRLVAIDHTTVTKNIKWPVWDGLLTRSTGAASTLLTMAVTPTPISSGTVTGAAIAATADVGSGCINLTFTPPTSNTDTWNAAAKVTTVEVQ